MLFQFEWCLVSLLVGFFPSVLIVFSRRDHLEKNNFETFCLGSSAVEILPFAEFLVLVAIFQTSGEI